MRRYVYVWEFEVRTDMQPEFERHYGPAGTWVQLFRQAPGYIGTILLQDRQSPTRYLTIDRWASSEAHDAFRQAHGPAYEQIDRLCESLTQAEKSLGAYWEVEPGAGPD